jgi:hypothetical protein
MHSVALHKGVLCIPHEGTPHKSVPWTPMGVSHGLLWECPMHSVALHKGVLCTPHEDTPHKSVPCTPHGSVPCTVLLFEGAPCMNSLQLLPLFMYNGLKP